MFTTTARSGPSWRAAAVTMSAAIASPDVAAARAPREGRSDSRPGRNLLEDRRIDVPADLAGDMKRARGKVDGEAVGARMRPPIDDQGIADAGADGDVGEDALPLAGAEPGLGPRRRAHIGLDRGRSERRQALADGEIGPVEV